MKPQPTEEFGTLMQRAEDIFSRHMQSAYKKTDRLFSALLLCEWVACIFIAALTSPLSWTGSVSAPHIHLLAAILFGGLLTSLPLYFTYTRPGHAVTRHVVAISQMMFSSLLIHLTGGRIETHFHIFGSLAFLADYKDWRILITGSIVVIVDHIVRGLFMPESIYGVSAIEPGRWLEHAWWVVFEDAFLIKACLNNVTSIKHLALRQAQLEQTQANIEDTVKTRTRELSLSERRLSTQYTVSHILAESRDLANAFPQLILAFAQNLNGGSLPVSSVDGEIWNLDSDGKLQCSSIVEIVDHHSVVGLSEQRTPCDLVQQVLRTEKCAQLVDGFVFAECSTEQSVQLQQQQHQPICAFAFPISAEGRVIAVVKFCSEAQSWLHDEELSMFESIGRQIGQFIVHKKAELNNSQLANIVQSSTEAIIGLDGDHCITSWNRGAERLLGYTAAEVISRNASFIIPHELWNEVETWSLSVTEFESIRLAKDGLRKCVSVTSSPILDSKGDVVGSSFFLRDIAERKESEKRVSEFYSTVSHELRTPLTSIRGALGLIEGGIIEPGSEEALDLIKVARVSSDRLIRLINDILDLKKIEAGKFDLAIERIDSKSLIASVIESLTGMSEQAGIPLGQLDSTSGTAFFADKDRCTQVLVNLVSNAIKFSPQGSKVTISSELDEDAEWVKFSVADTGPGISVEQIGKLFDKFQQLDSSDARPKEGTGLGLAISKAIVEEHGGTIGVTSELGRGTTFWFELPARLKAEKELDFEKSILLIESDNQLAQVMSVHIGAQGFRVFRADSLAQARCCLSETTPAVLVIDLAVPDDEVLLFLEESDVNPSLSGVPVILISDDEDLDKASLHTFRISERLEKPFDTTSLIHSIERSIAMPIRAIEEGGCLPAAKRN